MDMGKDLRTLGYTHRQFAEKVGAHRVSVTTWCSGAKPAPKWVRPMLDLMFENEQLKKAVKDLGGG